MIFANSYFLHGRSLLILFILKLRLLYRYLTISILSSIKIIAHRYLNSPSQMIKTSHNRCTIITNKKKKYLCNESTLKKKKRLFIE